MGTICPFSKTAIVAFLLDLMASPTLGFGQVYSTRHEFPSVKWASNVIRKQLVTSIADLALLH